LSASVQLVAEALVSVLAGVLVELVELESLLLELSLFVDVDEELDELEELLLLDLLLP
jgi:hypothetical protein